MRTGRSEPQAGTGAGRTFLGVAAGLAAAFVLGAGAWLAASRPSASPAPQSPPPPLPVDVATASLKTFSDPVIALGVAKARRSVTLSAPATEVATRILFVSGQHVAQGQVLAELKTDEQRAAVVNAQAVLDKARSDDARWTELWNRGFAPKVQLEQAQAALREAQAQLDAAQSRLRDRVIRAPFSGTIGLTDAAPGMLITPGAPIATLDDLSVILIDFDVPEARLGAVAPGAPVRVAWSAGAGTVELPGRIQQLDTRIKPDTHTLTVRAAVANPQGRLRPGMLLRVTLPAGTHTAPAAPETALQVNGEASSVMLLTPSAKGWTVQPRTVVLGARREGFVEIVSGLGAGDRVVADGLNRLRPGQAVRIREPAA